MGVHIRWCFALYNSYFYKIVFRIAIEVFRLYLYNKGPGPVCFTHAKPLSVVALYNNMFSQLGLQSCLMSYTQYTYEKKLNYRSFYVFRYYFNILSTGRLYFVRTSFKFNNIIEGDKFAHTAAVR